ncbi:hypothetical protein V8G54_003609 [Vigna mungo]|uniref:Ankyrin repeat-containing protein n=1 Tax=Vigna mungo TaxID=3915 RepID=A0AAQ3PAS2_VIGMU
MAATNQIAAVSSASSQDTDGNNHNITRIDPTLYFVAVKGNFQEFIKVQNLETLGKRQDLAFKVAVSEEFVKHIIDKCRGLVLLPNAKGETPLYIAAKNGHSSVAKLLVEHVNAFPSDIENGVGAEQKFIRAIIVHQTAPNLSVGVSFAGTSPLHQKEDRAAKEKRAVQTEGKQAIQTIQASKSDNATSARLVCRSHKYLPKHFGTHRGTREQAEETQMVTTRSIEE